MNKTEKYPNGYLPKIAYWMFKGDFSKVNYFTTRQEAVYGEISMEDENLIQKMIDDLKAEEEAVSKALQELNEFVARRFPNVIGI